MPPGAEQGPAAGLARRHQSVRSRSTQAGKSRKLGGGRIDRPVEAGPLRQPHKGCCGLLDHQGVWVQRSGRPHAAAERRWSGRCAGLGSPAPHGDEFQPLIPLQAVEHLPLHITALNLGSRSAKAGIKGAVIEKARKPVSGPQSVPFRTLFPSASNRVAFSGQAAAASGSHSARSAGGSSPGSKLTNA